MSSGLGEGQARASHLGEGVSVEDNGIDLVVHGEEAPHVPGPKADTTQVPQPHQGKARQGVLSLDRKAMGQCQNHPLAASSSTLSPHRTGRPICVGRKMVH